ncbi:MAG: dTDP-glucose 4,6-dehydratase [Flavobacteriales bacterium]|nr:dTDP-glucose 4,6-dehydratase [Flavobacteriales bacterium]MDW8431762.1 dTDP-glucose 4,6-dehydratase [Flavobacteriales bacterium]
MRRSPRVILVTGGAGFIGSHVVRRFVNAYPDRHIINLDKLTYAGNLANLKDVQEKPNYHFVHADICDAQAVKEVFGRWQPEAVVHLAAESHVDRSIEAPDAFLQTNVMGTATLMNVALEFWRGHFEGRLFYHISTDEVYGSLGNSGYFHEESPYDPQSPYSASKAASDHLVRAYGNTYGLPYIISNCSNNYGPYQFPEKLIPLCIHNLTQRKPLPVYGTGENVRDWLYVEDHARAIELLLEKGQEGQTYLIGGRNEWRNLDLVRKLCRLYDALNPFGHKDSETLITFVKDRPGHDVRYAINPSKVEKELGWRPSVHMEEGLRRTLQWYLDNEAWLNAVVSGAYREYYSRMYERR